MSVIKVVGSTYDSTPATRIVVDGGYRRPLCKHLICLFLLFSNEETGRAGSEGTLEGDDTTEGVEAV